MIKFLQAFFFRGPHLTFLANKKDSAISLVEMVSSAVLTQLSNESVSARKGTWVEIAPYGRHHHSAGMQVFDRNDAVEIIRDFANSKKFIQLGLPWYVGHPDHPLFKDRYTDSTSYGRIKELRPGATGLEARVRFNAKGINLVNEEEFDAHSPNWGCILDSHGNYRPRKLKSVGFTNDPNIDVQPVMPGAHLANTKELETANSQLETPNNSMLKTHVKETLLASGLLKPGATEEEVETIISNLANEVPSLREKAATVDDLTTQLQTAKTALTEAQTDLANERTAHATTVVDTAINTGRLETGKRDIAIENLANEADFTTASKAILDAEPKFKTSSATGELGNRSTAGADKGQQITQLCNEYISAHKLTGPNAWDQAFDAVRAAHTELFEK